MGSLAERAAYLSAPSDVDPSPMKQLKTVMVPQQTVISHINELMDDAMPEQTVVKVGK
jgi:hypothetical protein